MHFTDHERLLPTGAVVVEPARGAVARRRARYRIDLRGPVLVEGGEARHLACATPGWRLGSRPGTSSRATSGRRLTDASRYRDSCRDHDDHRGETPYPDHDQLLTVAPPYGERYVSKTDRKYRWIIAMDGVTNDPGRRLTGPGRLTRSERLARPVRRGVLQRRRAHRGVSLVVIPSGQRGPSAPSQGQGMVRGPVARARSASRAVP